MGRQRSISHLKEQNIAPEKEFTKMKKSNLPDAKLKTLVLRMLNDLSEKFNKDTGNIKIEVEHMKKNQSEVNNTITDMKYTLEVSTVDLMKQR